MFRWFLLFVSFTVLGQVEYKFDTVYVYEGEMQNVNRESIKVTRHYFVKSGSPDYFLMINKTEEQKAIAVFRDNKKRLIAEFTPNNLGLDGEIVVNVSIKKLGRNKYINPLPILNISKREEILDGSVKRFIYQVDRGKKFKNSIYGIDVDTLKKQLPNGVGFGDYYSLFPLGDYQPDGLVLETYASEGAEAILNNSSLKQTKKFDITVRFF